MNEPYRPQQPGLPPHYGPLPGPAQAPAPPRQSPPPAGQQPEQVVRVWTRKGWFGPLSLYVIALADLALFGCLGIPSHDVLRYIKPELSAFVLTVLDIV